MPKTSSLRVRPIRHEQQARPAARHALGGCVLSAALALAPLAVGAADSEGLFAVKGAGGTRCADFVTALDERNERLFSYGGWLEGYLTAINQTSETTYDLAAWETSQTLAVLLANHCRRNPEISFLDATRMMVGALADARLKANSELVEIGTGETRIRMYRETLRRVQTRLAEEGLYKAPVDGLYGDTTREALRAFQQKVGLEAHGRPDQGTLMQLLRMPAG